MKRALVALAALLTVIAVPATANASAPGDEWCKVTVSVPAIGVKENLSYYVGTPDDGEGTRIQNRGGFASPLGKRNTTTAGGVGNFFIAGHRNSAGAPLLRVRELRRGDEVRVRVLCKNISDTRYVYTLDGAPKYVDFFTKAGRRAQSAPVPFRPGVKATIPMVTISTCATQEDAARGDRRRDQYGNPAGRWVVAGELTSTRIRELR
jgi:sortase A